MEIQDQPQKEKILLEWKKKYTEAIIDSLKPEGNVLEIGFDLGFGAEAIQKYHPKTHTIFEEDPDQFIDAKVWAGNRSDITVVKGSWKDGMAKFGKFDAIFFNDYPLKERDAPVLSFLFPEDTKKSSEEAKELVSAIEKQMSELKVKFSDQEIESFYQHIGRVNLNDLPMFFKKLEKNGNISSTQYQKCLKKFHIENVQTRNPSSATIPNERSQMIACLIACLKDHMKVGSRFSCSLIRQTSNYEDPVFFDQIITDPRIDYREDLVPIKICDKTCDAFITVVEKK